MEFANSTKTLDYELDVTAEDLEKLAEIFSLDLETRASSEIPNEITVYGSRISNLNLFREYLVRALGQRDILVQVLVSGDEVEISSYGINVNSSARYLLNRYRNRQSRGDICNGS